MEKFNHLHKCKWKHSATGIKLFFISTFLFTAEPLSLSLSLYFKPFHSKQIINAKKEVKTTE